MPPPTKPPAGRAIKKSCFKTSLTSPTLYHPEQVSTFATATVPFTSRANGDGLTARLD